MSHEHTEPSRQSELPGEPDSSSEDEDWSDDYADYDIRDTIDPPTH